MLEIEREGAEELVLIRKETRNERKERKGRWIHGKNHRRLLQFFSRRIFQKLTSLLLPYIFAMAPRDYCSGIRKAYDAVVKALASNNIVAALLTGLPFYYLFSVGGAQARNTVGYYTSAVWVFSAVLVAAWLLGVVAMWRTMPNLLTVTIMTYRAFGYWCLVSTFLVLSYISSYLPVGWMGFILAAIMPSILFLLVCGDVLRAVRTRLYATLAATATAAAAAAVAAPVAVPVAAPV